MTTALVTGANKGIGLEIVKQLIDRGMTVYLGARDQERGEKAAADTGARFVQLDVTDPASIGRLDLDRLDVLVNNAGITGGSFNPPGDAVVDDIRKVFDTNVFGVIALTDAVLPLLRRSSAGRIVNMSSSVGSLAGMIVDETPISLAYVPSKTALNAVTVQYAKALRDTPIKVNAGCPGWCDTDLSRHMGPRSAAQGATIAVTLATLGDDGPTGGFFDDNGVVAW